MRAMCISLALIMGILAQVNSALACTGIRLVAADGTVVYARTLEFGTDLRSNVIVIPRGRKFTGSTPQGQPGLPWTTRYGTAGTNAFGLPIIVDGVNEQGLAVGLFYFPDYAGYQKTEALDTARTIAPWELPAYLLGTTATVDEAVHAVRDIRVAAVLQANFGFVPPCHYIVHDATGRCAVIEYVGGELHVYENPLGVFTNSPSFDWHLTNLRNYTSLSVTNAPPVEIAGIKLDGFGQGNGLFGLPGDFTPPARFVRAVAFSQSALPVKTADEGVQSAFHILNQFDIPRGAVRDTSGGKVHDDYTLWTSASDLKNRRFYFRTYANSRQRRVDLTRCDLDAKEIKTILMAGDEAIEDVTSRAK